MSGFPSPDVPPTLARGPREGAAPSVGLAVAGLVLSILGLCMPVVGVVGLVMCIFALVNASKRPDVYGGKGIATGGVVCGGLSILTSCGLVMVIILPATMVARDSARQAMSGSQLRAIGIALNTYAVDNKDAYPETGANLRQRLGNGVDPSLWDSPHRDKSSNEPSYIYVGGRTSTFTASKVLMFENPLYAGQSGISMLFQDGSVRVIRKDSALPLISGLKGLTTPEGTGWTLPPGGG
ncbi:MAG: DUF4190 domain-containing protein [Phycisphaerales bacterium]